MENAEVDIALEELENRLERLRALYEQYFMGIERIEPAIPRKDVDRRIYVLRREKIRNTAKRFKLQTIISRYNTFQQYWQRICREIEAGTYKRHVIRAERIAPGQMLTIAARKRLGRAALEAARPDSAAPEAAAPPSARPEPATQGLPAAAIAPIVAPSAPGVPRPRTPSVTPAAPPKPPARPAKPSSPLEPARPKLESLDTMDLDFMNDWDPAAAAGKAKRAPEVPARPFGRALTERLGASPPPVVGALPVRAQPGVQPVPPPPPRAAVPTAKDAAPPAHRLVVAPRPPPPPPPTAAGTPAQTGVRPVAPARPMPPAVPLVRPAPPRAAVQTAAALVPPRAAPSTLPERPARSAPAALKLPPLAMPKPPSAPAAVAPNAIAPKPSAPVTGHVSSSSIGKPAGPAAAVPPRAPIAAKAPAAVATLPAPVARPPLAKPAAPAAPPVADERVRELHARLVEAKRQTKDAATVSMEGLAKSMKATEAKLREQHKNRKIDFDVVIKDGKAVLKPIVR